MSRCRLTLQRSLVFTGRFNKLDIYIIVFPWTLFKYGIFILQNHTELLLLLLLLLVVVAAVVVVLSVPPTIVRPLPGIIMDSGRCPCLYSYQT